MKFKIGDKVRIRTDLKEQSYNGVLCVDDMLQYRGMDTTITRIIDFSYKVGGGGGWDWTDDMLENRKVTNWRGELNGTG